MNSSQKFFSGPVEDRVQFLEAIIGTARDLIVTVDENGVIESCNLAVEEMLGFTPAEVVGRKLGELMISPYREEHEARMAGHLNGTVSDAVGIGRRIVGRRKDGSAFPISVTMSEIRHRGQRLFSGVVRDITKILDTELELEKRTRELQISNTELAQFAAVAAHDLQAPLRTIGNFAGVLARRHKHSLGAEAEHLPDRIVGAVERMQSMIDGLLTLSSVGKEMKPKSVEVNDVFDEIIRDLEITIAEAQAEIVRDELPRVFGDRVQLRQLLQNLVTNAIKFRRPGTVPCIHFGAKEEATHWTLTMSDNGIGIEHKYFEKIFGLFQRLHGRGEYPGSGLGLSICRKIADCHGGTIQVESELGVGSRFLVTLPKARG